MRTFAVCGTLASLATLLAACEMNAADHVQVKAAERLACPRERVHVTEVAKLDDDVTLYEALACGKKERYACELVDEHTAGGRDRPGGRTSMRRVWQCRTYREAPKPDAQEK